MVFSKSLRRRKTLKRKTLKRRGGGKGLSKNTSNIGRSSTKGANGRKRFNSKSYKITDPQLRLSMARRAAEKARLRDIQEHPEKHQELIHQNTQIEHNP